MYRILLQSHHLRQVLVYFFVWFVIYLASENIIGMANIRSDVLIISYIVSFCQKPASLLTRLIFSRYIHPCISDIQHCPIAFVGVSRPVHEYHLAILFQGRVQEYVHRNVYYSMKRKSESSRLVEELLKLCSLSCEGTTKFQRDHRQPRQSQHRSISILVLTHCLSVYPERKKYRT